MKKFLLPLSLLLAAPAFAAQQEITAVPDSPVLPSIGALKDAVNLRLADIDENFDEIYPIIEAGPVYVNASAPADTKVVWIDTDQDNAIKVHIGEVWTVVGTADSAGDDLGSAAYTDVVALWTTCTGYLKSDGTCDTPSGSATYPSAAGVANWGGSAWGTSYTVGTGASNLVQLNASAQLPAISADLLTITDTGTYFTTDTVGAALQELGSDLADVTEITLGPGLAEDAGVLSVDFSGLSTVYQPLDTDLTTAAGADTAGNSKLFGTNASGVVGWYDIPDAGSGIAVSMQQVFSSSTTLVAGVGSKTKAITGVGWTTADIGCDNSDTLGVSVKTSSTINGTYTEVGTVSLTASAQNTAVDISQWSDISAGTWVRIDLTGSPAAATECTVVIEGVEQ